MDESHRQARSARARMVRAGSGLALAALLAAAVPAAAQTAPFSATKSFAPATIRSGNQTTLSVRLQNTDKTLTASAIGFSDQFPPGMSLVPGVDSTFQCGGTLGFAAGGFTFANGSVAPASFCSVTVTVTALSSVSTVLTNTTSAIAYSYGASVQTIAGPSGALAVTGGTPPTITSPPPPGGQVALPYDYAVTVAGTTPVALAASGLPPGLSISPATLHITGIPTTVGSYAGLLVASNGFAPNAIQNFTIVIQPPQLTIVTPEAALAPPVSVASTIDVTLQAVGGTPPYRWNVAGGALPAGVTLGTDGRLSGTPGALGIYTFDARVVDALGAVAIRTYTLVVVKGDGAFKVTVNPNPATSGQTLTVTATVSGGVAATGIVEVWVAGSGNRCPAPFEFGNPSSPVAPLRTATLDATGRAQVAIANLRIDDYGVCVRYDGDANYNPASAGPIDAYVIKGALIAAPRVALSVPAQVGSMAAIPTQVSVTPLDTTLVPGGSVRVLADGQPVATAELAGGVALLMLTAPASPASVVLTAEYAGDGTFPSATSAAVLVSVVAADGIAIPSLSDAALGSLALILAGFAALRLRRRPRA